MYQEGVEEISRRQLTGKSIGVPDLMDFEGHTIYYGSFRFFVFDTLDHWEGQKWGAGISAVSVPIHDF